MINIVYDSKTGNVERFINKLKTQTNWNFTKNEKDLKIDQPFHFITFTTGFGNVPKTTEEFLSRNSSFLISISSSGNMNWGDNFAMAADIISKEYNIPILLKFELSGNTKEVETYITQILNTTNGQ